MKKKICSGKGTGTSESGDAGVLNNEAGLAPISNQATQGSAGQLEHIIAMLERVLEQRLQQAQFQGRSNPHF